MTIEKLRLNCLTLVEARAMADEIEGLKSAVVSLADEQVQNLVVYYNRLCGALGEIARGRTDNGLPLPRETSREIARRALTEQGRGWSLKEAPD